MRDGKENVDNWEIEAQKLEHNNDTGSYSNGNDFPNDVHPQMQKDITNKWNSQNSSQPSYKSENQERYAMDGRKFGGEKFQKSYKSGYDYSPQLLMSLSNMTIASTNLEYSNANNYVSQSPSYNNISHEKGNFNSLNPINRGYIYPTAPSDLMGYPPIMPPPNQNIYNKLPYFPYPFPPPFINQTRNVDPIYGQMNTFNNNPTWKKNGMDTAVPYQNNNQHSGNFRPAISIPNSFQSSYENNSATGLSFANTSKTPKYIPPHLKMNYKPNPDLSYQNNSYQTNQNYQAYPNKTNFKYSNGYASKDSFEKYEQNPRQNNTNGQSLLNLLNSTNIPVDLKYWVDNYSNDPELEKQIYQGSNTGINFEKYKNIPIETSGTNCPVAIQSWVVSNINKILLPNIARCNYQEMTPVQKYAVGIIMAKRDLMACAQTGSGKTAAFLIPVMNQIMELPPCRPNGNRFPQCPYALILAPTRELALQIHMESLKFAYRTQMKSRVIYGGTKPFKQVSELKSGCHLLIATPGRLRDMVERNTISLEYCKFLILDEADKMLDMGFEPQIRDIVERYNMPPLGIRQTMMFSATFPKEIQILAKDFLREYIFLTVGKVGGTTEDITQKVLWVEDNDKKKTLLDILDMEDLDNSLILIFLERKKGVDALENFLVNHGFNACSIHGDHCQEKREAALDAFRSGRVTILLATSVASRGLDIPNVKLVINFDMPNEIDEYVHRIGRTGRVGNIGYSTTFINDKNRNIFKSLHKTLLQTKQEVPEWLRESAISVPSVYNNKFSSRYDNSFKRAF